MEFGLIGEHLGHSFSREIHEKLTGLPYELKEFPREELDGFMKKAPFRAINVTIPYKELVIPCLNIVSPEAARIGAVNTIVKRDGRLWGYNTDYFGFSELARRAGISFSGRKVLILGAGGAAKTVRAVAMDQGAASVVNAVRAPRCAGQIRLDSIPADNDFEIIVNATPVGMFPDDGAIPADPALFPRLEGALDLIYNPLRTNFILRSRSLGVPAEGGLFMLVAQAVKAASLFHSKSFPEETTEELFMDLSRAKGNIVLCGMPSSGKTTVGRLLAERRGLEFLDTDELIVGREGRPISEIFAAVGEAGFRRIESEIIQEVSRRHGCVIATGGGAVLDPSNVQALKRNGTVCLIRRSLELLQATADRPLSSNREALERLQEQRRGSYESAADHVIDNNSSLEDCLRQFDIC